jgi:TerC family integral membrane protein
MFDVPLWLWAATIALCVALIALEFVQASVRPSEIGLAGAAVQSVVYVLVALAFGLVVLWVSGTDRAGEYVAGWLIERSLSVDNLFVFVIVMQTFAVPPRLQPKVLIAGIAGALALRAIFIAVGAAALHAFAFTYVLFGAFLLYTAVGLLRHRDDDPEVGEGRLVRAARRLLPMTDTYRGARLVTTVGGRLLATPLLLVAVAILSADVLFALDSIPAVFGVTESPFIVFAANAFALLGMRALYFLVAGLLDRLVYLSVGLAVILAFVGVKLILQWAHSLSGAVPDVPVVASLAFIVGTLIVTTLASLWRIRREPAARAHAGDPYRRTQPVPRPLDDAQDRG